MKSQNQSAEREEGGKRSVGWEETAATIVPPPAMCENARENARFSRTLGFTIQLDTVHMGVTDSVSKIDFCSAQLSVSLVPAAPKSDIEQIYNANMLKNILIVHISEIQSI